MLSPDDSESSSDKDCEEQGDDYPTGCDETEAVSTMNHVGLVVKLERRVGKIPEKAMISFSERTAKRQRRYQCA
ncbi:hypothetical protein V8E54_001936 [Elaphomyces granulatus]